MLLRLLQSLLLTRGLVGQPPSHEQTLHQRNVGLATSLSGNDARIVFDISASLRRSGSPRGIHRVERQLALWAAANLTNIVFVFFDPIRLAYCTMRHDVRPFLTGEMALDTAGLPSVRRTREIPVDPSAASFRRTWLRIGRPRRLLLGALETVRRSTRSARTARLIDRLQRRLMSDDDARDMVQPNGARRTLVAWRAAIGSKLELQCSDILVCAGIGWEHTNIETIAGLKSRIRFRMVLLCHDLMPLLLPRVFRREARETFEHYIERAFGIADLIIVNSHRTEADCQAHFAARGIAAPQILVTPFGYDFRAGHSNGSRELPAGLESDRFVMLVSTIAPRKGHWLLYHVWLRLLHEGIPQAARFKLVFVGRPRFADDPMLTEILGNRHVADSLLVLTEVDDEQLAALYAGAAFCAYPSLYEGYGLPIVEAFAYGKAVLASTGGAVPEIVQDLSPCLDPTDGEAWYRAIKSWIENPALRAPFEEAIRARFRHSTWSEASAEFFRCVSAAPLRA